MKVLLLLLILGSISAPGVEYRAEHRRLRNRIDSLGTASSPKSFDELARAIGVATARDPFFFELWIALAVKAKSRGLPKSFLEAATHAALDQPQRTGSPLDQESVRVFRLTGMARAGLVEEAITLFNAEPRYCQLAEIPDLMKFVPGAKLVVARPASPNLFPYDACRIEVPGRGE